MLPVEVVFLQVLSEQLTRRLLAPIYLGSLVPELQPGTLHVSRVMALFLLTHITMTITHPSLQQLLLSLLLYGDQSDMQVTWVEKICFPLNYRSKRKCS